MCLDANYFKGTSLEHYQKKHVRQLIFENIDYNISPSLKEHIENNKEIVPITNVRNEEGQRIRTENMRKSGRDICPRTKEYRQLTIKPDNKTNCLTSSSPMVFDSFTIRQLTPNECELLQGYPIDYTSTISNTQRYKCLGNSFTIPVISHILSYMNKEPK